MKVSNRVKRNISVVFIVLGVMGIIAAVWSVTITPASRHAWFDLAGLILMTSLCVDNFIIYHRRVKKGIMFGIGKD